MKKVINQIKKSSGNFEPFSEKKLQRSIVRSGLDLKHSKFICRENALYVKARWDDLKQGPHGRSLSGYYLASNTAFTKDAMTYSKGVGLKLLGINAPEEQSLLDKIKVYKLYPITSLIRLKKHYITSLLDKKIKYFILLF